MQTGPIYGELFDENALAMMGRSSDKKRKASARCEKLVELFESGALPTKDTRRPDGGELVQSFERSDELETHQKGKSSAGLVGTA